MLVSKTMINILHPTDFSHASYIAFKHALRLALSVRGRLTIMHVTSAESQDADWSRFPQIRELLSHWGVVAANIDASDLTEQTGLEVRKIEASGNVEEVIGDYLRPHAIDFLVLATHGRTGLSAMLQPSVSRKLARAGRIPVLFVPEGTPGFVNSDGGFRIATVLVPVDNDPDPQLAIDWVSRFESWTNARIRSVLALHVGEAPLSPPVHPPHLAGGTFLNLEVTGDPLAQISQAAERHQPDLIVMSMAGPSSLKERWIGSTTERTVLQAPCPVLVVPEGSYDIP